MTELERLAATILAQWRADGGAEGDPIPVSALLDRVLPYRVARRILGIDASEDYEALLLRLLAEEEDLVGVNPPDAAEMARTTVSAKLPDLDVLQLLRSATVRFSGQTIARLSQVLPMPGARKKPKWSPAGGGGASDATPVVAPRPPDAADDIPAPAVGASDPTPASDHAAPAGTMPDAAPDAKVIPLHPTVRAPDEPQPRQAPPEFLTTVTFTPPEAARCWSCSATLPADRPVKFCPFCGADQRQPVCAACGATAEHGWKHCAECGATL